MKLLALVVVGCSSPALVPAPDGPPPDAPVAATYSTKVTATVDSTRFVVREHMLAAGEMQISGEPLAETMGRDLGGYSRDQLPPDLYADALLGVSVVDLPGFSTGVESYEYSKQPMNFLAFESGAGTSLSHTAFGANLAANVQHFAGASNALGAWVFPAGTYPTNNRTGNASGNRNPTGAGIPANNKFGWPGMWPTVHIFQSFDPAIDPTSKVDLLCAISSDDSPQGVGTRELCGDYECDASSLHLRDRAAQIDPTLTPGADGFTTWKYGLWTLNYLQVMHDVSETGIDAVAEADLPLVGTPGYPVFLGSSDIEGFQAAMFILESEARADDWLAKLTTSDGATLGGFSTIASAIDYDYTQALRWFAGKVAVTETAGADGFPVPAYALGSADSELLDQIGLVMGYSEFFALTDRSNIDVGGSQPVRAYFDGDPFPADDQLPNGDATLHDRSLAMLRVAIINIDRLHTNASDFLVDHVTFTGASPAQGHIATTITAAYAVLGLRTALRALGSQLELYSNNTPDSATTGALDSVPVNYPGNATLTFSDRVRELVKNEGELLYDHLTDPNGRAYSGWDASLNVVTDDIDSLDVHAAAIRGLFAAYLATGDTRYRDRALAVYTRMDATFYDAVARVYSDVPITPALTYTVEYTPLRFALLQSALRDMYELVASRPGGEQLELPLEARIGRLDKLVLNGWDDRNLDQRVSTTECTQYDGVHVALGGLQMAERALTGELGRATDEGSIGPESLDRDSDCVPEIDDAHLPAALADAIRLTIVKTQND